MDTGIRHAVGGRPILIYLARLTVAATLLGALFFFVPLDELVDAVSSMALAALAAAVLAGFAVQVGIALRIRPLLRSQGLDFTPGQILEVNLSTTFYGLVLPGGNVAGMAMRLYRFGERRGNYSGAIVMILFDRLIATGSMCAVGASAWLLERPAGGWYVFGILLGGLLATLAAPLAVAADVLPVGRLERLPGRVLSELFARLASALRLARTLPRDTLTLVLLLGIGTQVLGAVAYWFVASGMGLDISLVTMTWARSLALLLAILPISIAGLGVREGAFVALLSAYGVSAADSVVLALVGFAATTVFSAAVGGMLEAWRVTRTWSRDGGAAR